MTYLITGGAGFIGSHLTEKLLDLGHEVICLDNLSTGHRMNVEKFKNARFRFIEADVTTPIKFDGKIDVLFHFASPASPPDYFRLPVETLLAGSQGTYNALNLALENDAVFFLSSTSEIYGDPTISPQKEDLCGNVNPIWPRSVYEVSKRFAESITMTYHRKTGLKTRIVRIFNTYGPNMRIDDGRSIPNFIKFALSGEDITIYGDGRQTRSFCYIDDVTQAFILLSQTDYNYPLNIGNPEEISILDLARTIIDITGSKSDISFQNPLDDDPKIRKPDISMAQKILGWQPNVCLKEGLEKTVAAFKKKLRG
ncbi:NAD-dependent epimerase/dehydratase family protein [candidate division WOR-3 bacterium]|nr:NAD-dependent epimerase/dehydratase family protein [candidate division WOR-3 bacterium]